MMDNKELRLERIDLGPSWIDLSYGEPLIIREILQKYISPPSINLLDAPYQPQQGNKELISLLEKKYDANVVITNGAKHGIAATMFALKNMGHEECIVPSPYWVSHKGIITDAGLRFDTTRGDISRARAVMITSPNNPDGKEASKVQLKDLTQRAKADDCILIHDAAYYTPIYMENPKDTTKVGDVQIYSFSKMYGLSGARIGYVVVHNDKMLPHIIEHVERLYSGVSVGSQALALYVERYFLENPKLLKDFNNECRKSIAKSRNELKTLNPEVLEVMPCSSNSMFAWCKIGPKLDYKIAKVNLTLGDTFDGPGMVRINLAVNPDLITTAVKRLNNVGNNNDVKSDSKSFNSSS